MGTAGEPFNKEQVITQISQNAILVMQIMHFQAVGELCECIVTSCGV